MGGQACQMTVRAVLLYKTVPTDPKELLKFDVQMRQIHGIYDYSQAVVNETEYAPSIIRILEKPSTAWTATDRGMLLDAVDKVCGPYS
jgi:hypothetical protein